MIEPLKRFRKKAINVIKRLWIYVIFIFVFVILVELDRIYYSSCWRDPGNCFGEFCAYVHKKGFSYTHYLEVLRSNFGILVTAMSVIITMGVNNLNRFDIRVFGMTRFEFDSSIRLYIYRSWRKVMLFSPLMMIVAGYRGFCMLGYGTLLLCYLFIIYSYGFFESSFSREKDLPGIVRKLLGCVDKNAQDQEDIVEYRMLLNIMRQWNDENHYWEGANYMFQEICDQPEDGNFRWKYILCYCFFDTIYARKNKANYDRAVYALKEYISRRDQQGWSESDYLILWGLLHRLFAERKKDNIIPFMKWYLDFPARAKRLERRCRQGNGQRYSGGLSAQTVRLQTGLLLIEMELYFNSDRNKELDDFLMLMLSRIWNEGRYVLKEENEKLRRSYLEVNALYDFEINETEMRLRNLCADDRDGTTKSMTAYYLRNS